MENLIHVHLSNLLGETVKEEHMLSVAIIDAQTEAWEKLRMMENITHASKQYMQSESITEHVVPVRDLIDEEEYTHDFNPYIDMN